MAALANGLWAQDANNSAAAGLLVHVLDGMPCCPWFNDGFPPSGRELWAMLGTPDEDVDHGDRVSCSVINRRHPAMYRPLNIKSLTSSGFSFLPFALLHPDGAAGRLRCCYAFDAASLNLGCPTFGGDVDCVPGCTADTRYMRSRARWMQRWMGQGVSTSQQARAEKGGPFFSLGSCLDHMVTHACHDPSRWCALAYNEVVLDVKSLHEWIDA